MGVKGAGWAIAIANLFIFIGMNIYMLFVKEIEEAVQWPDRRMFDGLWTQFKLGVPLSLMLAFEWLAYEIMVLFCGFISVEAQAGQIIICNFYNYFFCIPLGLQTAVCSCIGFQIGR